jgi:predicted nucleic acid-binding protein
MLTRLLDSVILIDHLNNIEPATHFVLSLDPEETAISVITWTEILVGVNELDWPLVQSFLEQFHLLVIDKHIASQAAKVRRKHGWKLPDAFQAALCLHYRLRLVTRNSKDFDPQKHVFVEIPYVIST